MTERQERNDRKRLLHFSFSFFKLSFHVGWKKRKTVTNGTLKRPEFLKSVYKTRRAGKWSQLKVNSYIQEEETWRARKCWVNAVTAQIKPGMSFLNNICFPLSLLFFRCTRNQSLLDMGDNKGMTGSYCRRRGIFIPLGHDLVNFYSSYSLTFLIFCVQYTNYNPHYCTQNLKEYTHTHILVLSHWIWLFFCFLL